MLWELHCETAKDLLNDQRGRRSKLQDKRWKQPSREQRGKRTKRRKAIYNWKTAHLFEELRALRIEA